MCLYPKRLAVYATDFNLIKHCSRLVDSGSRTGDNKRDS